MNSRLFICIFFGWFAFSSAAESACRNLVFADNSYTACSFDVAKDQIETYNLDETGQPLATFNRLSDMLARQGKVLNFAMNAGMFGQDLKAIGLFVAEGKTLHKLNRRNGPGNFHMKPNGVFYVSGDKVGVMETEAFAKSGIKPEFATQSGPMLVIDGSIHPKISPSGTSAKFRNGAGMIDDHTVEFVISNAPVTFYEFASLFQVELKCSNALFFDGSISSMFSDELFRNDSMLPLGPMVGVYQMR